jgi:hypothetical protein
MGLTVVLEKEEETPAHCVYAVGADTAPVGRLRLRKASGDVAVLALSDADAAPPRSVYLAHVVPRLQTYHDAGTYPEREEWTV